MNERDYHIIWWIEDLLDNETDGPRWPNVQVHMRTFIAYTLSCLKMVRFLIMKTNLHRNKLICKAKHTSQNWQSMLKAFRKSTIIVFVSIFLARLQLEQDLQKSPVTYTNPCTNHSLLWFTNNHYYAWREREIRSGGDILLLKEVRSSKHVNYQGWLETKTMTLEDC